jgi:hypothetical protein
MFCFVEDNKIISAIENTITEQDWKKKDFQHTSGLSEVLDQATTYPGFLFGVGHRSLADNLRIWQEIIWHCCQNDRLFQNKWPKRLTHATYASDTWSSILQFVHNLFWLKLKWNARSKLFYCIIYRSSINEVQGHWQN